MRRAILRRAELGRAELSLRRGWNRIRHSANLVLELAASLNALLQCVDRLVVFLQHVLNRLSVFLFELSHLRVEVIMLLRLLDHLLAKGLDLLELLGDRLSLLHDNPPEELLFFGSGNKPKS